MSTAHTELHPLTHRIASIAEAFKADDIRILDLRTLTSYTDYFVVCSGRSNRQVQAIADAIHEDLKTDRILPNGIEGHQAGQWILLDYSDVVVHVFHPEAREFYQIEKMWADAPELSLAEAS
jgi:ribosome-associated protein